MKSFINDYVSTIDSEINDWRYQCEIINELNRYEKINFVSLINFAMKMN